MSVRQILSQKNFQQQEMQKEIDRLKENFAFKEHEDKEIEENSNSKQISVNSSSSKASSKTSKSTSESSVNWKFLQL